ncbi:MAG: ATP-binding cassette domain-containing protein [Alphaproteobacteria bacterium]|nr:ATP-binding cassette domain-containing protein [Alphaproteobacteria bacterium]
MTRRSTGPSRDAGRPRSSAWRHLWAHGARAKATVAEAVALALLLQIARLLPALGLALVIDKVATSHASATLVVILGGLALIAAAESVMAAARDAALRELAALVEASLPASLPDPDADPAPGANASPGARVAVARAGIDLLLLALTAPALAAVMLAALALADPALALAAILGGAMQIAVHRLATGTHRAARETARRAARSADRWRAEAALAVDGDDRWRREARDREAAIESATRDAQDALDDLRDRRRRLAMIVQRLTHVAALGSGALAIAAGTLTTGGLIAALMILRQVQALLDGAIAVLDRADALAPQATALVGPVNAPAPARPDAVAAGAIVLRDVVVRAPGSAQPALDLSLTVAPGSFVAIDGEPGAGKSLLLRVIAGAQRPRGGMVRRASPERAPLAFVAEDPWLPDGTIADIVLPGPASARHAARMAALHGAGALESMRDLPLGLGRTAGVGGRDLASSLRRRIALARALAAEPRILLLDALPDRLEPAAADRLLATLLAQRGRTTVVVVTTLPAWHAAADRRLTLRAGRVAIDLPAQAPRPGHARSA